jgi:hypothetical protein
VVGFKSSGQPHKSDAVKDSIFNFAAGINVAQIGKNHDFEHHARRIGARSAASVCIDNLANIKIIYHLIYQSNGRILCNFAIQTYWKKHCLTLIIFLKNRFLIELISLIIRYKDTKLSANKQYIFRIKKTVPKLLLRQPRVESRAVRVGKELLRAEVRHVRAGKKHVRSVEQFTHALFKF